MAARRKAAGIPQTRFCKAIGVEQPTLSQMEQGKSAWSAAQVEAACASLGCRASGLMDEVVPEPAQRLTAAEWAVVEAMRSGDPSAIFAALAGGFTRR